MTAKRRIINFIFGMLMIIAAVLIFLFEEQGLRIMLIFTSIGCTLNGLGGLLYYLTMARSMVGGKTVLYRAIIMLDLGLFTSSIISSGQLAGIMYVAGLMLFSGVVSLLRFREVKSLGSRRWKLTVLNGALNIIIALAVIISGLVLGSTSLAVYAYCLGLVYSGGHKIVESFQRTAIVYIQ